MLVLGWTAGHNAAGARVLAKDELDFGVRPEARVAAQLARIHRRNRASLHHKRGKLQERVTNNL